MGHGAGHHIEHAEHVEHAAHDSFNTRVTISIAIIAAALAAVSILGHKAHNMMLSKQLQAAILKNQAANRWAQFQAYNIRSHLYQVHSEEADFEAVAPGGEERRVKSMERWKGQHEKYETKSMPTTQKQAEKFDQDADELMVLSAHWHHKAERLDLGDLGLQFGVVLASMAILTKRRSFWFGGLASALLGFSVAMTGHFGVLLGDHAHEEHGQAESAPAKTGH